MQKQQPINSHPLPPPPPPPAPSTTSYIPKPSPPQQQPPHTTVNVAPLPPSFNSLPRPSSSRPPSTRPSHSNSQPPTHAPSPLSSEQEAHDDQTELYFSLLRFFESFILGTFTGLAINIFAICCIKQSACSQGCRGCGRDICEVGGGVPFVVGSLFGAGMQIFILAFIVASLISDSK